MTFKVNYGFQKAERDRAKQAKKDAKRREKEEAARVSGPASSGSDECDPESLSSQAEAEEAAS